MTATAANTALTVEILFQDGKWIGMAGGRKVVKSYDQSRVIRQMAKAGYRNVPIQGGRVDAEPDAVPDTRWDINTRFGFVSELVTMIARGKAVSLIVCGPGGLGKTHTVKTALLAAGLADVSGSETENSERCFKMIRGYSTAKGLYRELYMNRDSVIVFDDTDSVLRDPVALNLLKGALDSYDRRVISWNADIRDDDLPRSFLFTGRVIFITNMQRGQLDDALRTRAYVVDLAMTQQQKIDRMAVLAASDDFMPGVSLKYKQDALALIQERSADAREISLRTLQAVTRIRAAGGANWRELAEFCLIQ